MDLLTPVAIHALHTLTESYARTACGLAAERKIGEPAPFDVGPDEAVTCPQCIETLRAAGIAV